MNDSATIGHSRGFSPTLDKTKSMKYNGQYTTLNASSGNGFTKNRPHAGVGDNQTEALQLLLQAFTSVNHRQHHTPAELILLTLA